jgi:hypothetical protein
MALDDSSSSSMCSGWQMRVSIFGYQYAVLANHISKPHNTLRKTEEVELEANDFKE